MPRHRPGSSGHAGGRAAASLPGRRRWEWHRAARGRQQPPVLGSGARSHLGLSGADGGGGVPGLKRSRGLSRPGPLAAPSIGTGNTHTPMCQPRVGPRASPVPEHGDSAVLPFLGAMPEGARVGLEQGSTSRVVVPPIPRHLGGGEHGGDQTRPAPRGWGHPDAPGSRDRVRSARATVPECSAGAELCQACHRRRAKPSLCLIVDRKSVV